jgi:hypothetical protein
MKEKQNSEWDKILLQIKLLIQENKRLYQEIKDLSREVDRMEKKYENKKID